MALLDGSLKHFIETSTDFQNENGIAQMLRAKSQIEMLVSESG